ncbi:unnamed protein product [Rotaria sp. Silwood2]|nr:unnamed protein product [Rotaria sp. Silwood2]CAF2630687.1 unnamed protein product [Rotaria sp. Silwood2]CAF3043844.1 unnamed protein product [Rotaria sp. Silwood2]CAF3880875.1 unnamed protein product [Rotaria sp. Silwood2]CAF4037501.1 unnamed protein product [Rotaria sp. Silwood2]
MNKENKKLTFNVKEQQPLSVLSPPISTVTMSSTSLELTDTNNGDINQTQIENISIIKTSTVNLDSSEDDSTDSTIPKPNKEFRLLKLKLFFKRYIKLLKLVFQSIIPDLKSFNWWQTLILILFAAFNVVFSVLDFNSFFPNKQKYSILKLINDYHDGVPLWRRILLCLSGVAAFTNVLNVVLVIRGKISSYFWGIIGAIIYGAFSFGYGYVGDAQLYALVFLPMQFVGIYMWSRELDNQATTRVKSLKLIGWIFIILLCIGLGAVFFYEIPAFSKLLTSQYLFETMLLPHILDALTNALSVVAQFLLIFCYWEQYLMWIIVNIMSIIMYSGK